MYRRHPSRCTVARVLCCLAAAFLLHPSINAHAQVSPEASAGFLLGFPAGAFGDHVSRTGIGFDISGGIRLPGSPVILGAEFGYLIYGHDRRQEPFNATTPDVRVNVVTTNNIFQGNLFLRLQPVAGAVRPYLDGLVGFKYLYTETAVKDASNWVSSRIADHVNLDDWALAWGVGIGAAIGLWDRGTAQGAPRKGVRGVQLDIGVRYLLGTEAEYLKEGSIQIVGNQVNLSPERSRTDMIYPHLRVRLSF